MTSLLTGWLGVIRRVAQGAVRGYQLSDRIRQRLDAGSLPTNRNPKISAGYGGDQSCSGCGVTILPAHLVYEIELDDTKYQLHAACFGFWEAECRRRG
jgi:hypothetical protein